RRARRTSSAKEGTDDRAEGVGVLLRLVRQLRRPAGSRSGAGAMGGRPVGRLRHSHPASRQPGPLRPAPRLWDRRHGAARRVGPAVRPCPGRAGEVYLPEAVLVQTLAGLWRPALCYLCPEMAPRPADNAYVERIVGPARAFGFPKWYIARLE